MTHPDEVARRMSGRRHAVELCVEKMMNWYIESNGGVGPTQCCEDIRLNYVLRWLEPPIPHVQNPALWEGYEGDNWVCKMVVLGKVS